MKICAITFPELEHKYLFCFTKHMKLSSDSTFVINCNSFAVKLEKLQHGANIDSISTAPESDQSFKT